MLALKIHSHRHDYNIRHASRRRLPFPSFRILRLLKVKCNTVLDVKECAKEKHINTNIRRRFLRQSANGNSSAYVDRNATTVHM